MTPEDAGLDATRLLAELRVHQAELEAQNEELRRTGLAAQQALADYTDLYEFAPVGYATLRDDATIVSGNLQLASLLGTNRTAMRGRSMLAWLTARDRPHFLPLLASACPQGPTPARVFDLLTSDGRQRSVSVTTTRVAATGDVRVAFTDQTELRVAERAAEQASRMESISRLAGDAVQPPPPRPPPPDLRRAAPLSCGGNRRVRDSPDSQRLPRYVHAAEGRGRRLRGCAARGD